jgi:hypothetical protein
MLTGMYPWTHRAFTYRGMIDRALSDRNIFHLIGDEYTRVAFTQNLWADILLSQFEKDIRLHLPCDSYGTRDYSLFQPDNLRHDRAMGYYVFQDFLNLRTAEPHPFPGSLLITNVRPGGHLGRLSEGTSYRIRFFISECRRFRRS